MPSTTVPANDENTKILAELKKWFIQLDITPHNAEQYAASLLQQGVPSLKKFGRVVDKKGTECLITYCHIDEMDAEDVLSALLQEQSLVKPLPAQLQAAAEEERNRLQQLQQLAQARSCRRRRSKTEGKTG